ncbi:major antigen isoform X2 [Anoplophora glabripennis]|nr:major antigen isoform X2 [Anoplophora glabripennis]
MGHPNSKPSDKLGTINREVTSLRTSLRSNRKYTKENKDQIIQELVQCSNEVNALKGKVKTRYLEQVQSNISHAMEDVLSKNAQEQDLDMGAVETSSFVQLSVSKRQMSNKDLSDSAAKRPKNIQIDFVKPSIPTLQDIEEKLRALKPQINIAIEQRDLTQLRVHQETIKVLATDLEMIDVREHTPLDDKKKKLDKSIVAQHHKITKTMKEIRRDKDINYLVKQNARSVKELEDIQKEISDIDAAVSTLTENNDKSSVIRLRENIQIIKQRLSSVESVDESTKQMQMKLMKKLADILKSIDECTKDSSHSDLTKAKMNYEEIITNIASGNSIDKDEIKIKLQSLQSFINSIKDDNETILRGKQQLLNKVRQSFSFIMENEQKIENTEVELNDKEENKKIMELESFYNNWKSLQKSINLTSLDDFSEVDKVLSDIQKSIEQTRHRLAESASLPSVLNKKLNYSTPNLTSPKSLHSKFGSSLSVDQSNQSLIRTKVKVYNISTPQIQNINDQPVVLRNKQFYRNNSSPNDSRPFSKMEEIKTQVNYIKEKFTESQQKQHLKNKLESYIEIINDYIHHQNQRVADSAKTLLADIQEMLKNMTQISDAMNDTSQRRASIELSFENVVGIQGSVERLEEAVAKFDGKKGDPQYKKIVGDLSECRKYLRSIDIPPKYDMINQQREEILNKIAVTFNILESKCFNYYDDPELLNTKEKLNSLKGKVNRFTGAYGGVLYNQIEKDLNRLLVDVTASISDEIISNDITKDVEKHLKILEHRATKDQSFRRTISETKSKSEDEEKLTKLKIDLLNIKATIDTTPANAEDGFLKLKSRLDLVKFGLDQLRFSLEEEENQKDVLYNEVETLKNEVEAKISLAREAMRQLSMQENKDKMELEELKKIEERFKHIKPEIESFVGTTSDNKFYELDENSIRLILKMDKLQFERGSEAHKKKIDLLKDIYNYGDLLDQRAKESEDLSDIERALHDIEKNFARNLKLNDLETLKEKVTDLKNKLVNTQYNQNLSQRKQACIKGIEAVFEKIEANKQGTSENQEMINVEIIQDKLLSDIESQFGQIKKDIDLFYGTHSHSTYYDINTSLTALFFKLDTLQLAQDSELRSRKIALLKEMHSYKEILYNKAKEIELIQEIDKQLNHINKMVENYRGKDEELKALETQLKMVQAKINNIKIDENRKKPIDQKLNILIGEYIRFKKAKEVVPKDYIGSTSFFKDVENNLNKTIMSPNMQGVTARLAEIENEIYLVRQKATKFNNTDTSEDYKIIEDTLLRLKMRLNKLPSEYIAKQHQLEKAIDECFNILDERSLDFSSVMDIEKALDMIDEMFESTVREDDKGAIDEQLISLQVKLGKLRVNEDLMQRKNRCADRINKYLRLLKDKAVTQSN